MYYLLIGLESLFVYLKLLVLGRIPLETVEFAAPR